MDNINYTTLDIETSGLSKDKNFITCIGLMDDEGIHQYTSPAYMFRDDPIEAENNLIENFSRHVFNIENPFLTYNGISFDIPFISSRFGFHSKDFSSHSQHKHIDLMKYALKECGKFTKKDDVARHWCNLKVPPAASGAFLARVYSEQSVSDIDHQHMLSHNAIDLCLTRQIHDTLLQFDSFKTFLHQNGIEVE